MDDEKALDFVCLDTVIADLDAQDRVPQPMQSICVAIYTINAIKNMGT